MSGDKNFLSQLIKRLPALRTTIVVVAFIYALMVSDIQQVFIGLGFIGVVGLIVLWATWGDKRSKKNQASRRKLREEETSLMENSLWMGESDYLKNELLPAEMFGAVIEIFETLAHRPEINRVYGSTAIRTTGGHLLNLVSRAIQVADLETILAGLDVEQRAVINWTDREELLPDVRGFGKYDNGIFYQYQAEIVSSIWFSGNAHAEPERFIATLHELGIRWELMLVSWSTKTIIHLGDLEELRQFILPSDKGNI